MSKRKRALPKGFGLWPLSLALRWLDDNGYEAEAEEIRKEEREK